MSNQRGGSGAGGLLLRPERIRRVHHLHKHAVTERSNGVVRIQLRNAILFKAPNELIRAVLQLFIRFHAQVDKRIRQRQPDLHRIDIGAGNPVVDECAIVITGRNQNDIAVIFLRRANLQLPSSCSIREAICTRSPLTTMMSPADRDCTASQGY